MVVVLVLVVVVVAVMHPDSVLFAFASIFLRSILIIIFLTFNCND